MKETVAPYSAEFVDCMTEVAGKKVNSVEDFTNLTKDVDPKKGVRLYVVGREGGRLIYLGGDDE